MDWPDKIFPFCGCLEKAFVCSWEYPLENIHTPIILDYCDGVYLSIFFSDYCVLSKRWALLFAKGRFTDGSQVNSRRYHLVFCKLTCPPVDLAAAVKMFRPSWYSLTVSSVGLLGNEAIWNIVESSTRRYIFLDLLCRLRCSILRLLHVPFFLDSWLIYWWQCPMSTGMIHFLIPGLVEGDLWVTDQVSTQ